MIWLLCQQLTHAMETGGVEACAQIVAPILAPTPSVPKTLPTGCTPSPSARVGRRRATPTMPSWWHGGKFSPVRQNSSRQHRSRPRSSKEHKRSVKNERQLHKVQQAFRILHPQLAGYVCQELRREYQDNWWQEVLMTLSDQTRDLPDDNSDYATLMDSLDIANCLRLFDRKWNDLFKRKLSIDYRTWAKELMGVRNKLAHIGGADFSEDDTWRALDTMARLCEAFDDEAAEEIRKMLRQLRYGSAEAPPMSPK